MAQGGDLRVLLGALAGVGLGGVLLLTALPVIVPLERTRPPPAPALEVPAPPVAPAGPAVEAAPEAKPTAPVAVAAPVAVPVPRFDTVRVAPDGSGLVAGQAGPGAIVSVLAGEEVAAEVAADAEGRFVAFLDLPPSAEPRALSLRDGAGGISEETVLVAPTGRAPAGSVPDPAPSGAPEGTAAEEMAAAPDAARAAAEAPATRDLPSDRPTPRLALAEDSVAAMPPGIGSAGEASAAEPLDLGRESAADADPGGLAIVMTPAEPGPAIRDETDIPRDDEVASAEAPLQGPGPGSPDEAQGGLAVETAPTRPDAGAEPASRDEPEISAGEVASEETSPRRPDQGSPSEGGDGVAAGTVRAADPDGDLAPRVTSAGPAEASVPMEAEAPGASSVSDAAPPSVALAVRGPVPSAPDGLPEHAPAPTLADAPGGLPSPDSGAPGQAAVLVSDAEGVRVLQPALPPGADAETLATVALDAIAYGGEGEVLLSGRASGGGAVRLYLDNALVAEGLVGADGQWSASLDGAEEGTFTLRLDQLDAAGEVVSRMEMPFRREARSDLAALMAEAQQAGQTIAMRTVQPGNTLWAIARDRYGEPLMYVRVYEMNRDRIRDPDLIYPGQVFVLPATAGR